MRGPGIDSTRHLQPGFTVSRPAAASKKARPLQVMTLGCESLADLEPQGLAMTYWLDPLPAGAPYPVSIRFVGQRVGVKRKRGPLGRFGVVESLEVVPGSGPVAITAGVNEIAAGDSQITARPFSRGSQRNGAARSASVRAASLATASGLVEPPTRRSRESSRPAHALEPGRHSSASGSPSPSSCKRGSSPTSSFASRACCWSPWWQASSGWSGPSFPRRRPLHHRRARRAWAVVRHLHPGLCARCGGGSACRHARGPAAPVVAVGR